MAKEKRYWMFACPHCEGSGRERWKPGCYKVAEELQDEGPYILKENFTTLAEARKKVKQNNKALMGSCMHTIIAPDGEIVK